MGIKEFRYDGSQALELNKTPTSLQGLDRDKIQEKTLRNMEAIGQWQDKLYADGREGIVILLQAMDAAGKDSAIKHVMGCVNPQGLDGTQLQTAQPPGTGPRLSVAGRAGTAPSGRHGHFQPVLL